MMIQVLVFLLAASSLCLAAPNNLTSRAATLADGSQMQYGSTSNGLSWQASGVLQQGCSSSAKYPVYINDCYQLSLSSNPSQQLDSGFPNSPRQRIEFLTKGAADGTSHTYKWRYYLSSQTGTTNHFFHLMQVFSRGDNGPVVTLDAVNGRVAVTDAFRSCSATGCPSIPLSQFTDRTTLHTMSVTYGPAGKLNYVVTDAQTGAKLLSYSATGKMGSQSTSLKMGTYRLASSGMTIALARLGDFTGN